MVVTDEVVQTRGHAVGMFIRAVEPRGIHNLELYAQLHTCIEGATIIDLQAKSYMYMQQAETEKRE